jgi:hypothetical protein
MITAYIGTPLSFPLRHDYLYYMTVKEAMPLICFPVHPHESYTVLVYSLSLRLFIVSIVSPYRSVFPYSLYSDPYSPYLLPIFPIGAKTALDVLSIYLAECIFTCVSQ